MNRQRRFGTEGEAALIEATQIKALIDSLSRRVELLECDLVDEQERTGCRDPRQPGYSGLARGLIARRDNLIATIASLQERVCAAKLYKISPIPNAVATCITLREGAD